MTDIYAGAIWNETTMMEPGIDPDGIAQTEAYHYMKCLGPERDAIEH
jgi:hypothetical protein